MNVDFEAARHFFSIMLLSDRLRIVAALDAGELSVSELAEVMDLPYMKVIKILITMRLSGILACRREGANMYYRINSPVAHKVLDLVKEQFPPKS